MSRSNSDMSYILLKSSAALPIVFGPLILSSDHINPATGLAGTLAVTISKNGGAFATPFGALTEIGSGWYKLAGNVTDTNTTGPLALHATVATADPFDQLVGFVVDPAVPIFGVTVVGTVDANVTKITGTPITGAGTALDPWGPV